MAAKRENINNARLEKVLRMATLTGRSIQGKITEEEADELNEWLYTGERNRQLFEAMKDDNYRKKLLSLANGDTDIEEALAVARQRLQPEERIPKTGARYKYLAAAAAAAILVGCLFYLFSRENKPVAKPAEITMHDVPPGGNKAVLTLANGKQIVLDSNASGLLARQGNMQVVNLTAGQLAYNAGGRGAGKNETPVYNTLTTPRGGQYQVILPDGSKVWLNAASSLRYPANFTGNERGVTLTGEAYFEVIHNENKPFTVTVGKTEIKDIGTAFNINAYQSRPVMTTTVVKGAVSVSGQKNVVLTVGKQALITAGKDVQVRNVPDIKKVIAWKEGLFWFNEESITEVMDQIARWYNVDVEYRGQVTAHFSGSIHRDVNVSVVFKVLEETGGVHFHIDGRKIIVTP